MDLFFLLFMFVLFRKNAGKLRIVMIICHRSTLMAGGAGASGGTSANPWLINESDETKGLTFGEIKQQQQRVIEGNYMTVQEQLKL